MNRQIFLKRNLVQKISISVGILLGFSAGCYADTVTFSTGEGYTSGNLGSHPQWLSTNRVNMNGPEGRLELNGFVDAVHSEGEPLNTGDIYTAQIDFSFRAGDQNSVTNAPNRSIINVSLYGDNVITENRLKIGLSRVASEYAISVQDTWNSNAGGLEFTGGAIRSSAIDASSLGIVRDSNLQTDPLRLRIIVTKGVGQREWRVTGELLNNLSGGGDVIASVNVSGLFYETTDTLRAGFGSGQSNANAGIGNRFINEFQFSRTGRGFDVSIPSVTQTFGSLDINGNDIADFAELTAPTIAQLPREADSDGDGISNIGEARAGTDPFDSSSFFRTRNFSRAALSGNSVLFSFASVPGVRYQVQYSDSLEGGTWRGLQSLTASSAETTVDIPLTGLNLEENFFRARVLDAADSDSDGIEDNLELYLGFDPDNANSVNSASRGGDFAQFHRLINGASTGGGDFNTDSRGVPSPEQTSRFLAQASFGPNEELIRYVRSLGNNAFSKWIDEQIDTAPTLTEPYRTFLAARIEGDSPSSGFVNSNVPHFANTFEDVDTRNFETAWMRHALFAPDRLRQRVAWVLSQILVSNDSNSRRGEAQSVYYDLLIEGALGSYEELLYEVSVNPQMGNFLSSLGNRTADPSRGIMPDENYAREIMQLFSIGLWELDMDGTRILDSNGNPIPTYSNDDIVQVARVFTGLEFSRGGRFPLRLAAHPMQMIENRHDTGDNISLSVYGAREKEFLQSFRYTPAALPAFGSTGRSGLDDIRDTVSILVNHPTCPPFISRNLIQHLVTSNPSPSYVRRVAEVFVDDGSGARGNLAAVIKAILLDDEARSLNFQLATEPGRLKAPMLRVTSLAKAFRAGEETPALHDLSGIQFFVHPNGRAFESLGEYPFHNSSVFNFYEPGYSHPGEIREANLTSPEFQILNSLTAVNTPNQLWDFIDERFHTITRSHTPNFAINLDDFLSDAANDHDSLLDRLNLLLCHGRLSAKTRGIIKTSLDRLRGRSARRIAEHAVYLVLSSPDSAILR